MAEALCKQISEFAYITKMLGGMKNPISSDGGGIIRIEDGWEFIVDTRAVRHMDFGSIEAKLDAVKEEAKESANIGRASLNY